MCPSTLDSLLFLWEEAVTTSEWGMLMVLVFVVGMVGYRLSRRGK